MNEVGSATGDKTKQTSVILFTMYPKDKVEFRNLVVGPLMLSVLS